MRTEHNMRRFSHNLKPSIVVTPVAPVQIGFYVVQKVGSLVTCAQRVKLYLQSMSLDAFYTFMCPRENRCWECIFVKTQLDHFYGEFSLDKIVNLTSEKHCTSFPDMPITDPRTTLRLAHIFLHPLLRHFNAVSAAEGAWFIVAAVMVSWQEKFHFLNGEKNRCTSSWRKFK